MSDYQLRLYRGLPGNIPWRIHVDSISLEADNDTVAREKARTTEIWPLDIATQRYFTMMGGMSLNTGAFIMPNGRGELVREGRL